jgi:hypothetical protein
MISRLPLRFGGISSVRGTGVAAVGNPVSAAVVLLDAPRRSPPRRFPLRFGGISSVRGTGLRVAIDPATASVILLEAPPAFAPPLADSHVPNPRFPVRYARVSGVRGGGLIVQGATGTVEIDRAEYDVAREIAFRAATAFAQMYAEAYPDVSGGVVVVFEEVYPI